MWKGFQPFISTFVLLVIRLFKLQFIVLMKYIYALFFSAVAFIAFSQGSLDFQNLDRPVQEIVEDDGSKLIIGSTSVKGSDPESYILIKRMPKVSNNGV